MRKFFAILLFGLLAGLSIGSALAENTVVRGESTLMLPPALPSGPNPEQRQQAMHQAQLAAWRNFLALPGNTELVDQVRADPKRFESQLDSLLVEVVVVADSYDASNGNYNLRIKATVAQSVLSSVLRQQNGAAAGGSAGAAAQPKGSIMYLTMARQADAITSYKTRNTDVAKVSGTSELNVAATKAGGSSTSQAAIDQQMTVASGGSKQVKRDSITYQVGDVSLLNSKLSRVMLQNHIKATPYAFLMNPCKLPKPDTFSKQYAASAQGELPAAVLAGIQSNLAQCNRVKYWVFASMDTGGYQDDPNTGLKLVTVTVNVQMYEVETGAEVVSVSKDIPGRSADQTDAIKTATDNAVQAVGDIIATQLSNLNS